MNDAEEWGVRFTDTHGKRVDMWLGVDRDRNTHERQARREARKMAASAAVPISRPVAVGHTAERP